MFKKRTTVIAVLGLVVIAYCGVRAADFELSLIEMYSLDGFPGFGNFAKISDIVYDPQEGELLVSDEGARRIYVFRSNGDPLRILGTTSNIPAPLQDHTRKQRETGNC